MRSRYMVVVVLGCALAAGCGTSQQTVASAHGVAARHAGACSAPASLPSGARVAPWRLGNVLFLSAKSGVAITSSQIPCVIGPGGIVGQRQPVRLAVTKDGGRHWAAEGSSPPEPAQWDGDYQIAAVSGSGIWIFSSSTGRLLRTRDHGATWTAQRLPAPLVSAASAGGWLWALSCPAASKTECVPVVERMRLSGGTWTRIRPVTRTPVLSAWLSLTSGDAAVISLTTARTSTLASTADGGAHWSARPAPVKRGFTCTAGPDTFTATGSVWWLVCGGGTPSMQGTNTALLRSGDAGRTWSVLSVSMAGRPTAPGAVPVQPFNAIAAGSAGRLWVALDNGMYVSTDGGKYWSSTSVNPDGSTGQFDVLRGTAIWLLGPGAGLWQSENGTRWHAVGALGPS